MDSGASREAHLERASRWQEAREQAAGTPNWPSQLRCFKKKITTCQETERSLKLQEKSEFIILKVINEMFSSVFSSQLKEKQIDPTAAVVG